MSEISTAPAGDAGGSGAGDAIAPTENGGEGGNNEKSLDFKGTKHRVKVDDQELEVDYDDLLADYQRKEASNRRFQQASELANQAKPVLGLIEALQTGDREAIERLSRIVPKKTLREFAEDLLLAEYEYEDLSAEEKETLETKRENAQLRKEKEAREAKEEAERSARSWQKEVETAGKEIEAEIDTFFKQTGVEQNPHRLARLLEFMLAEDATAHKSGEPRNIKRAYDRAVKTLELDGMRYTHTKSPEEFLKMAPPTFVEKLRDHFVKESQKVRRFDPNASSGDTGAKRQSAKKLGIDEWFATKEQQLRG